MNYNDLVHLYFERSNALQNYWTVYVVVIGGLLAFSSLRKEPDMVTSVLISILFAFFAYKNCGAIEEVSYQRLAVLEGMKNATMDATDTSTKELLEPTLRPPAVPGVTQFHLLSDLLTLGTLWAMEARRRRNKI